MHFIKQRTFLLAFIAIALSTTFFSCGEKDEMSVAFYNVENLFDTINNPVKNDEWFLPSSEIKWNAEKYEHKLSQLSKIISEMVDGGAPDVIGLCEVENIEVVNELFKTEALKAYDYQVLLVENKDERGIDVALAYKKGILTNISTKNILVDLSPFNDKTRDIFRVDAEVATGQKVSFYVNHWPSRGGGQEESEPKRIRAATSLLADCQDNPNPKIIMGDFNDEPDNTSILNYLGADGNWNSDKQPFYNCMFAMDQANQGTYCYRGNWNMLDQIIIDDATLKSGGIKVTETVIYSRDWMRQHSEKYEGYPLRTFGGRKYLGGYSDHFPVYIKLAIVAK